MKMPVILLSFKQLVNFGMHMGHNSDDFNFLSSWIFYAWYSNIFVIDLYKTFMGFSTAMSVFYSCAKIGSPLWFVCLRSKLGPLVASYAYTSGELYNIYWWMNGSATNFYSVLGWSQMMARLMMLNRYKLSFKDKKSLTRFFGFVNHSKRLPGACFVPTLINNNMAVSDEFQKARLVSVGMVDSNMPSTSLVVPMPGNDDSFICVNFYCYLLTKAIFSGKIDFVYLWNWQIKGMSKSNLALKYRNLTQFMYLYNNFYKFNNKNIFFETFNKVWSTELYYTLSVEDTMSIWIENTQLVGDFSLYMGKVFSTNEFEDELSMNLKLK